MLIPFWRYIYIILQRLKVIKKSHNSRNHGFSSYFCLLIGGSGSIQINADPGSPKAYGSGTLDKNKHKQAGTMHTESTCRPVAWITGPCPPFKMSVCIDACDHCSLPSSSSADSRTENRYSGAVLLLLCTDFSARSAWNWWNWDAGEILSLFECTLTKTSFRSSEHVFYRIRSWAMRMQEVNKLS